MGTEDWPEIHRTARYSLTTAERELPLLQIHKELVQSQSGISDALHQKFLTMLLAMEDVPAVLIVLADHLHLMRTQPSADAAQDALDVFAPLANRLGVWSIKAELEDLSFKVTAPSADVTLCNHMGVPVVGSY